MIRDFYSGTKFFPIPDPGARIWIRNTGTANVEIRSINILRNDALVIKW
jgi:hypothetical protein